MANGNLATNYSAATAPPPQPVQSPFKPERVWVETVEMLYLGVIILTGLVLNLHALHKLLRRQIRTPNKTSVPNFHPGGSAQISTFTLFKVHLSLTDFAILLVHASGKCLWLLTFEWRLGHIGCKLYQFLSASSYYANSNVVVAIALDRLKVVMSSRTQGAASMERVRFLLTSAWSLAAICALPQLFVWTTVDMGGWHQCTTVWQVTTYFGQGAIEGALGLAVARSQFLYEMLHQLAVFWLPFVLLLTAYFLIVVKVLQYTIRFPSGQLNNKNRTYRKHKRTLYRGVPKPKAMAFRPSRASEPHIQDVEEPSLIVFDSSVQQASASSATRQGQMSSTLLARKSSSLRHLPYPTSPQSPSSFSSSHERPPIKSSSFFIKRSFSAVMLAKKRTSCRVRNLSAAEQSASHFQLWKSHLRSKVFTTAMMIVLTHMAFWLPYNLLNTIRFLNAELYDNISTEVWAVLLDDLIILNSLVNPILYGYRANK